MAGMIGKSVGFTLLVLVAGLTACGPPRARMDDPYAPTRARAMVQSAEARDASAIPRLVALLEDDDSGVRLYAILALERLTGERMGYDYGAPEPARAAAVRVWRDALREGRVRLRPRVSRRVLLRERPADA